MATTTIKNFSSLMTPDIRSSAGFARVQHFKVFPHKLVPEFNTEADESKALGITRFAYAPWLATTDFNLFGYGIVVSTTRPAVYIKGSVLNHDPISASWGTPSHGTDAA